MRPYSVRAFGLLPLVLLALPCHAGTDTTDTLAVEDQPVPFRHTQELRPEAPTGTSITLYGGVNAFQDGTLKITASGVPGEIQGDNNSELGGVAGIKIGYTWPGFGSIGSDPNIAQSQDLVQPAIFGDFFWTGDRFRADGRDFPSGSSFTADRSSYTFQVEPTIKFNLGFIRPYFGVGFGGTYTSADHARLHDDGETLDLSSGSGDDFDFSASGIAGVDIPFAAHWALMFEYKYFIIVDPTFDSGDIHYHLDTLGNHLFTAGISYYF